MDVSHWEGQASWAWPTVFLLLVSRLLSVSMWEVG